MSLFPGTGPLGQRSAGSNAALGNRPLFIQNGTAFLPGVSILDLHGRRWTVPLFAYSIAYLAALFTILAIAGLFA